MVIYECIEYVQCQEMDGGRRCSEGKAQRVLRGNYQRRPDASS